MKTLVIAVLVFVTNSAVAQNHDHHASHHKQNSKNIALKNQFVADADLKMRMEKILSLIKELNPKKDDIKTVKVYGNNFVEAVNDIIRTCKLEPEADQAIHPLLGLILEGASELKNGKYESGHKKIHQALLDYEKIFKHEGWKLQEKE